MRKKRLIKPYQSTRILKKKIKVSNKDNLLYLTFMMAVVLLTTLTIINLDKIFQKPSYQTPKVVLAKTTDVVSEREFWTEFLDKNPNYLPGLLEMARIELQEGNRDTVVKLLGKSKQINPNDERVTEIEKLILKN